MRLRRLKKSPMLAIFTSSTKHSIRRWFSLENEKVNTKAVSAYHKSDKQRQFKESDTQVIATEYEPIGISFRLRLRCGHKFRKSN